MLIHMRAVIDIILLAIIALCTWGGYKRGLIGGIAGLLAIVVRQVQPLLDWLRTLDGYFQWQSPAVLLQVLGIALVAQLAADTCKEAGLSAAATAIELCGRVLALLQALPLLQSLLGSFAAYLQ